MVKARSDCPIASTLDLVGDRWSLLIVRDMLEGKRRYGEFLAAPERIAPNILASRLERMIALGLIRRLPVPGQPFRHDYALTAKGANLLPLLQEMSGWARRYLPRTRTRPAAPLGARRPPL